VLKASAFLWFLCPVVFLWGVGFFEAMMRLLPLLCLWGWGLCFCWVSGSLFGFSLGACGLGLPFGWVRVVGVWGLCLDGEFDPGSGRTLAACLTHASRAERPFSEGTRAANG
jgi:hypothetical protein